MWRNDIAVMCTTSPALDVYTSEETEKFVTAIASQPNAKAYIIEYKETGKPVGIILLIQIDYKNRSAQCIINIGDKTIRGKGIVYMALLVKGIF